jgi:phage baseplate assembly protein W
MNTTKWLGDSLLHHIANSVDLILSTPDGGG